MTSSTSRRRGGGQRDRANAATMLKCLVALWATWGHLVERVTHKGAAAVFETGVKGLELSAR